MPSSLNNSLIQQSARMACQAGGTSQLDQSHSTRARSSACWTESSLSMSDVSSDYLFSNITRIRNRIRTGHIDESCSKSCLSTSFVSLSHYRTISPSSHIHHPHSEIRNAHNNYSELEIMPSPSPQAMPSLSTPSPQVSIGHTQHPNPAQMLSILNSNLNNPNHSHLSNSNSG